MQCKFSIHLISYIVILPQSPSRGPAQLSSIRIPGGDILHSFASDRDCNVKTEHCSTSPVGLVQFSIARCKTSMSHPF
jgi:hypothetical protein